MRLDQFLVQSDICSRSEAKKIIKAGRICVDDAVVKNSSVHIDPESNKISFDGEIIEYAKFHYYMLNKPAGCVSATRDGLSSTVIELLNGEHVKNCFPVGRLDKDTEGLLLITDDGKLAHELLSPRHHVDKSYEVHSDVRLSEADMNQLMQGVDIGDDKPTLPADLTELGEEDGLHKYKITIHEGRYHQIKRMFASCGATVVYLKRLTMGPISLDANLGLGKYRKLTEEEIDWLKAANKD